MPAPVPLPASLGEMIREEFLAGAPWTPEWIAEKLELSLEQALVLLDDAEATVSRRTADRLAALFKTSPEFWLNLQALRHEAKGRGG